MTEQAYTGYWWDAANPSEKRPGTLRIEPDGRCELFLIQGFRKPVDESTGQWDDLYVNVIHGEADGTEVSLLGCRDSRTNIDIFTERVGTQDIRARKALIGLHLEDLNGQVFRSCEIQIENLHSWVRAGKPSSAFDHDGEQMRLTFKDETSTPFEAEGYSFTVKTSSQLNMRQDTRRFPSVVGLTTTSLKIESSDLRSESGFNDLVSAIVDLLSFARDEPCSIIKQVVVHGEPEISVVPKSDEHGRIITREDGSLEVEEQADERRAEVHTSYVYTSSSESRPRSESKPFLFTAATMPFSELLPKWLELRRKVRSSTDMLFSLLYSKPRYVEVRMLVAAAAAEALSRSLYKDVQPMLPFDFDRLLARSLGAIDPSDHERFLSVFRNEPKYRDRVLHLACLPSSKAVDAIIPDRNKWADDLRDARHGLAHGLTGRANSGNLLLLYERTVYLVYLVLMHELGFSESAQLNAVRRNQYLLMNRNP